MNHSASLPKAPPATSLAQLVTDNNHLSDYRLVIHRYAKS